MDPVRAVDVDVAGRAEHRPRPRRLAAIAVARRIGRVVGLDLDDAPAHAVDEQRAADELRSDLVDRAREEVPAQWPEPRFTPRRAARPRRGMAVASSRRRARRASSSRSTPASALIERRSSGPARSASAATRSARATAWSTSPETIASRCPMSTRIVRSVRDATIGSSIPSTQTSVRRPQPRRSSVIGSSA